MTDPEITARNRWLALVAVRLAGAAGGALGVLLVGRGDTTGERLLGAALLVSALVMIAVVSRSLARRWRSPPAS